MSQIPGYICDICHKEMRPLANTDISNLSYMPSKIMIAEQHYNQTSFDQVCPSCMTKIRLTVEMLLGKKLHH